MKILLIEPPKSPLTIGGEDVFLYESLALEYIAAGVAREHDVKILDLRLDKNLAEVLAGFSPDIVGITSYTVHVDTVRRLFRQIKEWNPEVLTVVGGHHATVAPADFLSPGIDLIVMGEGVFVFREIVRRRERREGFVGIPGVAIAKDEDLVGMNGRKAVELDALPFPDRSLTARYRPHYYSEWMKPLASIRTSKGCPYRCNFCALWKLAEGRYFRRKPEKIVEELGQIEEPFVFFADDESLVDAPRMKRLAALIREAGLRKRFFLYGRSDTIARNPELLEAWREAGLERVFVGLEFFRDEDLDYVGKGSTISDNASAVRILHDLGIEMYASFIVRPEFTREDFAAIRRYCRELKLNFASFAVLTPLPGTDLFEQVKDRMIVRDYDFYDFIHTLLPTALPLADFYEEYTQLYRSAVPMWKQLAVLARYPLSDILPTLAKSPKIFNRMRNAYRDYTPAEASTSSPG